MGERAVMADGNDYSLVLLKDQGQPVEVVTAAEGSPLILSERGVPQHAKLNAARLFQSFYLSVEAQQLFVDAFAHLSFRARWLSGVQDNITIRSEVVRRSRRGARADRGDQGDAYAGDVFRV